MNDQARYESVDMPFYRSEIAPVLPPEVLDFHTHIWRSDQWLGKEGKVGVAESGTTSDELGISENAKYMTTMVDYSAEDLLSHGRMMFPDRPYNAVCFGQPTPAVDVNLTNDYVKKSSGNAGLYPLCVAVKGLLPRDVLKKELQDSHFLGFKVFLGWVGDDYGNITIPDMIGPDEMSLADELGLVVLLHVPRAKRLVDPVVHEGVTRYAREYSNARIVLAHCGRCYLPSEMISAVDSVKDLENVYLDTAMVMEPTVLRSVFDNIDSRRMVFATDLPIASMRGRRVYVMDHWVDLVLEGYPPSAYRVATENMRATFMVYEIIQAIRIAGEQAGLSLSQVQRIFFQNGMDLLGHVMGGDRLQKLEDSWSGERSSKQSEVSVGS